MVRTRLTPTPAGSLVREKTMSTIIDAKNCITPFTFQGGTIRAVSANITFVSDKYEPSFQLCGAVWGDGCYPRSMLIDAGAVAAELDAVYAADKASQAAFLASL